jgi:hypothetical protein
MTGPESELADLIAQLDSVAAQLRAGDLEPDDAAALVERCAELAGRIGAGLDAESRGASQAEGQERLL